MASAARSWIAKKRDAGIGDFSSDNLQSGEFSIDEVVSRGVLQINARMEMGIATETEVGLAEERYPIFVRLVDAAGTALPTGTDTVVHYWPVVTPTLAAVPFSRRPDFPATVIANLYDLVPDIDSWAWTVLKTWAATNTVAVKRIDAAKEAVVDSILATLSLDAPTPAQITTMSAEVQSLFASCARESIYPYIKLSSTRYMFFAPHGVTPAPITSANIDPARRVVMEYLATRMANYTNLAARYTAAPSGLLNAVSYAIAANWRYGFFESHEHAEYIVVDCVPTDATHVQIVTHHAPPGCALPQALSINTVLDLATVKHKSQLAEFGNGLLAIAGHMHYLFNHTTGGNTLTGPLMSMAMLYKLYNPNGTIFSAVDQTSVFYEALHPVNKRLVANLILKNTQVATYGRSVLAPELSEVSVDTFLRLRSTPYPAGSHKAYVTLIVLGRLCRSYLAPFLPWSSEINSVINICRGILSQGARAHVGSAYYTGLPPVAQGAELDAYLPDLAAYIQTMAKNDTLAFSPHLSAEVAARSNTNWTNMLKKVRSEDISTTDPDVIKKFLATTGSVLFSFNPADPATWANAAQQSTAAADSILKLIKKL